MIDLEITAIALNGEDNKRKNCHVFYEKIR